MDLFTQIADWWKLLVGAATGLGTIFSLLWWIHSRIVDHLRERIRDLERSEDQLTDEKSELRRERDDQRHAADKHLAVNRQLRERLEELRGRFQKEKDQLERDKERMENRLEEAKGTDVRNRQRAITALARKDQMIADLRDELVSKDSSISQAHDALLNLTESHQHEVQQIQDDASAAIRQLKDAITRDTEIKAGLSAELEQMKDEVAQAATFRKQVSSIRNRLDPLTRNGRLWNLAVASTCPPFRKRQTQIVSIVNLKGGVGKTTITANLGATLAEQGKRVLLIDLDFQRSLSQMLLTQKDRRIRHSEKRCLQHLLEGSRHSLQSLLRMVERPIGRYDNCWIIPNSDSLTSPSNTTDFDQSDSLEEAETRLMLNWIFREDAEDIRFLLRRSLHDAGIESHFDYILLDCPPRLTTACINGLAASDYFLVPTELDALSTGAVPNMLRFVNSQRTGVFQHLQCLGVIANQATKRNNAPVKNQYETWRDLNDACRKNWPTPCRFFETILFNSSKYENAANRCIARDETHLAIEDAEIKDIFRNLSSEFERAIHVAQSTGAASVYPGTHGAA